MDNKLNVCYAGTSVAHSYGNVTSIITEYVKNLYPKDYFKTVFISSSIGYKQMDVFRNKRKEFLKKDKPMLIIRPRIDISDEDRFMNGTALTERMTDGFVGVNYGNLQNFFVDKDREIYLKYLLNRLKISFDVTIVHQTMIEQVNMAYYLKNRIKLNHNFFLDTQLESYIPDKLMSILSSHVEIPMVNGNGKVKDFLTYVNSHTVTPVTYKLQNSSGNQEFFRYYPTQLDVLISGLSLDDGSKRGMTYDAFATSFSVTTEFWGSGLYYLFSRKSIENFCESMADNKYIIPLFTIPLNDIQAPNGWSKYTTVTYKVDAGVDEDVTDFSSVIGETLESTLNFFKSSGIPLETIIDGVVFMNSDKLEEGVDYVIDYTKMIVRTKKLLNSATYRLVIFTNISLLNDMYMKQFNLE